MTKPVEGPRSPGATSFDIATCMSISIMHDVLHGDELVCHVCACRLAHMHRRRFLLPRALSPAAAAARQREPRSLCDTSCTPPMNGSAHGDRCKKGAMAKPFCTFGVRERRAKDSTHRCDSHADRVRQHLPTLPSAQL